MRLAIAYAVPIFVAALMCCTTVSGLTSYAGIRATFNNNFLSTTSHMALPMAFEAISQMIQPPNSTGYF